MNLFFGHSSGGCRFAVVQGYAVTRATVRPVNMMALAHAVAVSSLDAVARGPQRSGAVAGWASGLWLSTWLAKATPVSFMVR